MKLLMIKIGKAFNTLKREGILKGGRRVFKSFFSLFHIVGKGDVLFITGGVGDSALYRVKYQIEELALHGIESSYTVQDNPLLSKYSDKFKVFIFHRVLYTPSVANLIKAVKKQGKEIIFETDDLVFDPQYLIYMDYFSKMNTFEKKLYEKGVGGEILIDDYVKICTTTTTFLADKLKERGKEVFISTNKLSDKDLEVAENILKQEKKYSEKVRVGYFSGTISHNKDFATVTSALVNVMEKNPQVELFLVGPLDLENELISKFQERIVQLPYVEREKHFENISKVDINIAPLEIGNPFCESKSELKFFEAGILNIPTVAAATRTFKEAIEDGVDGFVAHDTIEWEDKINKLINDEKIRSEMGEKARKKTLEKYTNKNSSNQIYYDYLRSKL